MINDAQNICDRFNYTGNFHGGFPEIYTTHQFQRILQLSQVDNIASVAFQILVNISNISFFLVLKQSIKTLPKYIVK